MVGDELKFYDEDIDQAVHKLGERARIDALRRFCIEYLQHRADGPTAIINEMYLLIEKWVLPEYKKRVSKGFAPHNLHDFTKKAKPSKLQIPNRLLVHVYLWISYPPYREEWGGFPPPSAQNTGTH